MPGLIKKARYKPGERHIDSAEIDRIVNQDIGRLLRIAGEDIKSQKPRLVVRQIRKLYYLNGTLYEDGIPLPLKDEFRAKTLREAKK